MMENNNCEWVGSECGHHASYTFFKGVRYLVPGAPDTEPKGPAQGPWKVLSIGQFFFVKIWGESDLVSVAELQLLWEDKNTGQKMSSVRLYFLPEFTGEGRLPHHGQDEMIAVGEKAVLRVVDLVDWIAPGSSVNWEYGAKGISFKDCPGDVPSESQNKTLDMSEVDRAREELGDNDDNEQGVVVVSAPHYFRYRSILKRLEGVEDKWMKNSLVVALGGFTTKTRRTAVMFAKEIFDYPELEEHPQLCNHLAPKLKGRPRKRRKHDVGSPEGSEPDSTGSDSALPKTNGTIPPRSGARKDLINILSQKNTKEELIFLKKLIRFMEDRGTPIERPPMLGFKQIDLHLFYEKICELGGYDGCVTKKAWKSVYDDLGGNPLNTSAATCTRRHYERFLLPFELHMSSDEGKGEITLDETSGNLINGDEPLEQEVKEPTAVEKVEEKKEVKPFGLKPLQLLTEPSLHRSEDENKLKIDDLIIIPNSLNPLEEGGSALQNLAKIASRYSSLNKDKSRAQDFTSPSAKKPRVEDKPGVAQPLPPTTLSKKTSSHPSSLPISPHLESKNAATASALLQQFSLLSPGLFGAWPGATVPPTASPSSSTSPSSKSPSSWLSGFNLDSKPGTDGYNLLKYYEQQLKALQQGGVPSPTPSARVNGTKETPVKKESKAGKEKQKVCKPPPDTKKPPKLLQSPCQFLQTSNIYGSPKSDLIRAKESASKKDEGGEVDLNPNQVLDLSSGSSMEFRTISPHRPAPSNNSSTGAINLSRPEVSREPEDRNKVAEASLDLTTGRSSTPRSDTSKMSPFSAEALLSRPSSRKNDSPKSFPPLSMGIRGILEPERSTPQSSSPWQPPPPKPAAPVPPVVRSTAGQFYGISLPSTMSGLHGLSTETTFSSLSSLPTSSLQPSSAPSTTNPYLQALMSPFSKPPGSAAASPAAASFPGLNSMDPLSQYYAALYSQQMSAYNAAALGPYAASLSAAAGLGGHGGLGSAGSLAGLGGAAGLAGLGLSSSLGAQGLGLGSGLVFSSAGLGFNSPGSGLASTAGLRQGYMSSTATAELQALQAYKDMMTRSAMSSVQQPSPSASAASNPYAALYAGLMGYPGFPPPRKDQ